MTRATSRPIFAERVAAATAADRDRFIDAVRAGSLLVVVLGHWLMATVTIHDGRVEGGNALTAVPALQPATWVLQVMPLFFIAGGFSNLTVWRGLRRRGVGYPAYLQGRLVRLLRPTLVFVLFWQLALPVAAALGLPTDRLDLIGLLLGQPLWFLGVYVATTALAPSMLRWHERSPLPPLLVLAVGAVVVDWFRFWRGMENVGYLNLALVWLFAQQLGFWYAEGRFTTWRRVALWAVVGGCVVALTLLTALGPYPVSVVGLPGETSNMTPPTVCLLVLAVGQLAAALLLRPLLSSALQRPRAWAGVVRFGAMAMTVYLWHLSVLVLAYFALISAGVTPPGAGTGLWWATRPFWLLGLAAVTTTLATALAPLERGRAPRRPAPEPAAGAP
ncbi:acyltransferase, partial [Oryzihumus sp.]|uniref:acyltransferase family protein n=1 Tax=Oryzihumus sp. TaxID=1968903 RepID=UPI002ED86EB9